MKENLDINSARKDFYSREGEVGKEASVDKAAEWLFTILDTLDFSSYKASGYIDASDAKQMVKERGMNAIRAREGTPLQNAEEFFKEQQKIWQ